MDLIKKAEARAMLGISMNTLDKLIREGRLPAYRVTDHAIRLDRADVTGYLESRRIQPPPRLPQCRPLQSPPRHPVRRPLQPPPRRRLL